MHLFCVLCSGADARARAHAHSQPFSSGPPWGEACEGVGPKRGRAFAQTLHFHPGAWPWGVGPPWQHPQWP